MHTEACFLRRGAKIIHLLVVIATALGLRLQATLVVQKTLEKFISRGFLLRQQAYRLSFFAAKVFRVSW